MPTDLESLTERIATLEQRQTEALNRMNTLTFMLTKCILSLAERTGIAIPDTLQRDCAVLELMVSSAPPPPSEAA